MRKFALIIVVITAFFGCQDTTKITEKEFYLPPATTYNYVEVDSAKLFYREAGDKHNPTIVLLHGYPSSSHSYRNLIPMLATRYHVIAPDNLGSGYSTHFDPSTTNYTFDLLASYMEKLVDKLDIENYVMYMQDFGAPVGYRMMMNNPKRVDALIVQNANAYLEGLTPQRQDFFRTAQTDTSTAKHDFLYSLTGKDAIINKQYLFDLDSTNRNIQSPDAWTHDLAFLTSKKDREIQVQLFKDYNTNLIRYPKWQKMLQEQQPKTLIAWGKKDLKFNANGAKAYLKDLPKAELHLLDAGHFAAEEKTSEIATLILKFLAKNEIE
ncbi:pimeloyl-ACP methyl ester carboxylesterase [Nonlabens xylanidelens]|uniref:Pimeloyl-ACP methyl ester carboxylesterase n=1 Tax=Nonlabens xylanidelens TaxID=191564 RepID=A0A2S6IIQ4_9FLAO|nr:alpha/beta hydrolase [Nonlabens xylanidelens]PPK94099.1 pimeloyl-ACP methyl ester carboxylesterase [Nonlabens xylanidelens]PQJ22250.1 alpha/beta hydrolase [Nonlabens xylanidelens]